MTRAAASGHHAWVEARRNRDFASFLPYLRAQRRAQATLRRVLRVGRQPLHAAARRLRARDDAPTEVREVFAILRPALTALVARGARGRCVVPPRRRSRPEAPAASSPSACSRTLGLAEGAWRLDPTAHPFCTSFSNRDVRLTTRYRPDDLESIWSTLHEAGHGLYAHGIADSLLRSPLHGAPSLGINESQSRTWENLVGRSRPFWEHWYGPLQETFPQLGAVPLDDFVRAINRAEPGLIRVDADETTYSLHIILRFELEQEMVEGTVDLADLPEIWDARMQRVPRRRRPARTGTACSRTSTGRAAGSATSRRTRSATSSRSSSGRSCARRCPTSTTQLAAGDLLPLSSWLRDNLYSLGRKLTPKETLERLTGIARRSTPARTSRTCGDKIDALGGVSALSERDADAIGEALAGLERDVAVRLELGPAASSVDAPRRRRGRGRHRRGDARARRGGLRALRPRHARRRRARGARALAAADDRGRPRLPRDAARVRAHVPRPTRSSRPDGPQPSLARRVAGAPRDARPGPSSSVVYVTPT